MDNIFLSFCRAALQMHKQNRKNNYILGIRHHSIPMAWSSRAMMVAVRAASLYCFSAMYILKRYFASWEEMAQRSKRMMRDVLQSEVLGIYFYCLVYDLFCWNVQNSSKVKFLRHQGQILTLYRGWEPLLLSFLRSHLVEQSRQRCFPSKWFTRSEIFQIIETKKCPSQLPCVNYQYFIAPSRACLCSLCNDSNDKDSNLTSMSTTIERHQQRAAATERVVKGHKQKSTSPLAHRPCLPSSNW